MIGRPARISNPDYNGGAYRIINNQLGGTRSRAILTKGDNGLIAGITIKNSGIAINIVLGGVRLRMEHHQHGQHYRGLSHRRELCFRRGLRQQDRHHHQQRFRHHAGRRRHRPARLPGRRRER
ncbi:MAG: hypothetical protein NTU80_08690 [Verrucomicrobia bacterium]|nr:hypothetical protein [Verrucomicrobiota bacterium]